MNPRTIVQHLKDEEFPDDVISITISIYAMNIRKPIKNRHLLNKGLYTEELMRDVRSVFFDVPEDVLNLSISLYECIQSFEIGISLHGLGGCTIKTFKQLLEEKDSR